MRGPSEDWRSNTTSLGRGNAHHRRLQHRGILEGVLRIDADQKNTNRSERFAVWKSFSDSTMRLRGAKGEHFSAPHCCSRLPRSPATGCCPLVHEDGPRMDAGGRGMDGGIFLQPQKPWFRDSRVAGKPFARQESRFQNCFMSRPGGHKHHCHFQGRFIPTLQCPSLFHFTYP